MAQIPYPSTHTIVRVSILGAVFMLGGLCWLMAALNRSSYATAEGVARQQPVQFSHEHRAGLGLTAAIVTPRWKSAPLLVSLPPQSVCTVTPTSGLPVPSLSLC